MKCLWFLVLISLCWAGCPTDTSCEERFNKCYKYVNEEKDFFDAEDFCSQLGGHLVSISNVFEGSVVLETAQSMFAGFNDYWIGANHLLTNNWSWTDGSQWGYTNWFPGQPETFDAVSATLGSGLWSPSAQNQHKPFVCELPYTSKNVSVLPTCPVVAEPTPCPVCATTAACPTTLAPTQAPRRPFCQDGWVHFTETKSCYKAFYNLNGDAAVGMCKMNAAHLTSIHSLEENDFIADYATANLNLDQFHQTLVGMRQVSGIWRWDDSTPVDFTYWASGEPNGGNGQESCLMLFSDSTGSAHRRWNDCPCSWVERVAVCKKPELL